MKILAVIPARYASTRFPAKLMQDLAGKTVIARTLDAALATQLFDDVLVVTDSEIIFREVVNNGGKAIMSIKQHESGSDRIAEAVALMDADVIVNVQGDEPFIAREPLAALLDEFKNDLDRNIDVGSLMRVITNKSEIESPNNVKVVVDQNNFALYFSRSVIPYSRDQNTEVVYYQHIGVYAYRKQALIDFTKLPIKNLESAEKLEQLRYLEFGKRIKMVETNHFSIGIDTEADLAEARKLWSEKNTEN